MPSIDNTRKWLKVISSCRIRTHHIHYRLNRPDWFHEELTEDKRALLLKENEKCMEQISLFEDIISTLPPEQRELLHNDPYKTPKEESNMEARKLAEKGVQKELKCRKVPLQVVEHLPKFALAAI